jgi:ABC-type multidrug transport system fused ATPase/permease subunit
VSEWPDLLHAIQSEYQAVPEIHYVYTDGYLLAAPSQALLDSSIQNRANGYTLTSSAAFTALIPHDQYTNFSAMVYYNVGSTLSPLVEHFNLQPVIELDNLEVRFGERTILKKLNGSFTGRAIGLLGPNGAGKSTLINTLLGFHQPSAGTARIFGKDIRTRSRDAVRGLLGYMPENDSFIAGMTGVHFVRLMAELSGLAAEQAMERAHEAFFWVGLGEVRYRKLGTYSLGMKQWPSWRRPSRTDPSCCFSTSPPTASIRPRARA